VLAVLLTVLIAFSAILSLTVSGTLTSAYTPEDLDVAQEKEARLRQELEEARAEEARLKPFLERFSNKELDELLDGAFADMCDVVDEMFDEYVEIFSDSDGVLNLIAIGSHGSSIVGAFHRKTNYEKSSPFA